MASSLKTLSDDDNRYQKSFKVFLTRSSEHQRMLDFIHGKLPDILENVGDGSPHLNVIGVGSGEGSIDLELLAVLRHKHPEAKVDNEVVEPSSEQLHKYKISVSQKTELAHVNFNWNRMTASEFEAKWTEGTMKKKADFIHMIQMLYYVKDPRATISFFQSLLKRNGKLLIILVSGQSGWAKLWGTFKDQICHSELSQCVTTADIRSILDSAGVKYQGYQLTSRMDISECFVEGDENGDMLLDFLTEVSNFNRTASPELKASIMEMLRHPDCSVEVDGKIMFNNNLEALVLDALP